VRLSIVAGVFAVCRFAPETEVPSWIWQDRSLLSLTYTPDELSIVCAAAHVPDNVRAERGWAALKVEGPLDFSLTGILSALAGPLADAGIAIFALSTFDTDYLLLKRSQLERACEILEAAGHTFYPNASV
jgi:hypothetical protein